MKSAERGKKNCNHLTQKRDFVFMVSIHNKHRGKQIMDLQARTQISLKSKRHSCQFLTRFSCYTSETKFERERGRWK